MSVASAGREAPEPLVEKSGCDVLLMVMMITFSIEPGPTPGFLFALKSETSPTRCAGKCLEVSDAVRAPSEGLSPAGKAV